ncbi:uncharacterized protein [Argopecten irradians]|uniref:uncharacterized protein n=1 Tax=Argopecten irradians TaxID=31199 RepID=UPI00371DAF25
MADISINNNTETVNRQITQFLENGGKHELAFQEIFNCSASCGGSEFTKAVFRMPYFGIFERQKSDPREPWMSTLCRTKDIFDYNILSKLVDDPDFDDEVKLTYADLKKFIEDKTQHEACLQKLRQSLTSEGVLTETDVAYALAVHVYAPLSNKQTSCILNSHTKGFPMSCPGGCGRSVTKGTTGIGAVQTWHGYADVITNNAVPVKFFFDEPYDLNTDEELQEKNDSKDSLDSFPETRLGFYQSEDPISEILALTITNSFAQVNRDSSLKNGLIPSIACSMEDVMLFCYDSESDLLACVPEHFRLWSRTNTQQFDLASIVRIWLYMNFRTFMLPSVSDRFLIEKSNFHKIAPLRHYKHYTKCGVNEFRSKDNRPRVRGTRSPRKRKLSSDEESC